VAIFYMGTQTYYASRMMDVSLRCIFGHQWTDIPNQLPESAKMTTRQMIAFFLTWLFQFPFAWLHPSKAGPLFVVKSVLSPIAYIATMIWALVKFQGVNLNLAKINVSGGQLGWSFMRAVNTVVSGVVPPMVNIADLARYGNRPRDVWPLTAGLFVSKPLVILIGLFTTAAGAKVSTQSPSRSTTGIALLTQFFVPFSILVLQIGTCGTFMALSLMSSGAQVPVRSSF
jgi:NCS1 family nucleobase:cation symporter-1